MTDVHSKAIRSYNMSQINSSDTTPETLVRKYLFSKGLRYRKNDKRYPGCPDVILPKYNIVVFVNGCFWHMHEGNPCFVMPKTRVMFWKTKLISNRRRDDINIEKLKKIGWKVIVVWECELKKQLREERLSRLYYEIVSP